MIGNIAFSGGNITYRQGTTAALQLTLKDDTGAAIDPTGWTFKLQGRVNYAAKGTILDLSSTGNQITVSAGKVNVYFVETSVSSYIKDQTLSGVYQMEGTDTQGVKQIILDGKITIIKDLVS